MFMENLPSLGPNKRPLYPEPIVLAIRPTTTHTRYNERGGVGVASLLTNTVGAVPRVNKGHSKILKYRLKALEDYSQKISNLLNFNFITCKIFTFPEELMFAFLLKQTSLTIDTPV